MKNKYMGKINTVFKQNIFNINKYEEMFNKEYIKYSIENNNKNFFKCIKLIKIIDFLEKKNKELNNINDFFNDLQ